MSASEVISGNATEREDFRATSDPALFDSPADGVHLLDYRELYLLWERQAWRTQDIDFSSDRADWDEDMDDEEREAALYALSTFFVGEQRVAEELGPIARAAPTPEIGVFLSTQIADEARHVAFFDRFYGETGLLGGGSLDARLRAASEQLNPEFGELFDEALHRRIDTLAAKPDDLVTLVEAVTIYHMVVEGILGLTGQHVLLRRLQTLGRLPGFVSGFLNVARDEHRHVAFGTRFLRDVSRSDTRYAEAVERTLAEVLPLAEGTLRPRWVPADEPDHPILGITLAETREFAAQSLSRRLKVIGLGSAA